MVGLVLACTFMYFIKLMQFIMVTQSVPLMMIVLLLSYHSGEYHVIHSHCEYVLGLSDVSINVLIIATARYCDYYQ